MNIDSYIIYSILKIQIVWLICLTKSYFILIYIFLLSQTKKYADVIIPRGADNTGTDLRNEFNIY